LISAAMMIVVPFSSLLFTEKLLLILFSPIAAMIYWCVLLLLLLVSEYLGVFGIILSRVIVLYFYLFSRLVVQRPPIVSLPLTRG
jgi:hypothetical protein